MLQLQAILRAGMLLALSLPLVRAQGGHPEPALPRITSLKGAVAVRQSATGEDVGGVAGLTLAEGDILATGAQARVEIQLDDRVLHVGGSTQIRVIHVEWGSYQLQLERGTFVCHVLDTPAAAVEVKTPSVTAKPALVGIYRMTVTEAGETEIVAYEGNIEVYAPGGSEWVPAGQKMVAHGPANNPEFKLMAAGGAE